MGGNCCGYQFNRKTTDKRRIAGTNEMTLLITVFAAVTATIVWYNTTGNMKLGFLSLMYWGASLMWLVDAVAEYIEIGAEYFTPAPADMLNDAYLGLSIVALGLVIWLVMVLIKDPKSKLRKTLKDNSQS